MFYWIMRDGRIVIADHLPIGPCGTDHNGPILAWGELPYCMGVTFDAMLQR